VIPQRDLAHETGLCRKEKEESCPSRKERKKWRSAGRASFVEMETLFFGKRDRDRALSRIDGNQHKRAKGEEGKKKKKRKKKDNIIVLLVSML